MTEDRINLTGMVFDGHHGWTVEEQRQSQPFEVDVVLSLPLEAAGRTDDLEQTEDYAIVFERVRQVVESTTFRLLEALAEAIAGELLAGHSHVEQVEVRIRKPRVRLGGRIERAEVLIVRRRAQTERTLTEGA